MQTKVKEAIAEHAERFDIEALYCFEKRVWLVCNILTICVSWVHLFIYLFTCIFLRLSVSRTWRATSLQVFYIPPLLARVPGPLYMCSLAPTSVSLLLPCCCACV